MQALTDLPEWRRLAEHYQQQKSVSLQTLFDTDKNRFSRFSLETAGILLDYSKNHINDKTLELLLSLARAKEIESALQALASGEKVNQTENQPALHRALRQKEAADIRVNKENIVPLIQQTLLQMAEFTQKIHKSQFTDIVNIGIGGSHLGPSLVCEALAPFSVTSKRLHFVSTLDRNQITDVLSGLNPATTFFIISSKSFATEETRVNAAFVKTWLGLHDISAQSVAITANIKAAQDFGIKEIFPVFPWVGGRYSVWSAIGLPIAIKIGMENFQAFLEGASLMDTHALASPLSQNMPAILALLNIWTVNFFGAQTRAILPYDYRLSQLPCYLQQLEMESNGKQVCTDGSTVCYDTGPVIWGGVETNGQHAFHQLLHQGTQLVPVDFIIAKRPQHTDFDAHTLLFSHCLSQARVLMTGRRAEVPHKVLQGNRPSNMIILSCLTPLTLGALIALYEYKVFISAAIWSVNPFDQWGVEASKQVASEIYLSLKQNKIEQDMDNSTKGLMQYFKSSFR